MSYTRFSVVLDHTVAFESLYGKVYIKCMSAFVIMVICHGKLLVYSVTVFAEMLHVGSV